MKIGNILETLVDEAVKNKSFIVYHGSPTEIKSFTDEFVGGEDATDQEGPGIYFTTSIDDASGYGNYIHKVELTPTLLYDESEDKNIPEELLLKLIMMAPDWEMNAQDWAEEPESGAHQAIDSAYEYNTYEKDVLLQIWIGFYRYSSVEFVRNCVKLGIDGIIVNRESGIKHVIVYNPSIIQLQEVKKIS